MKKIWALILTLFIVLIVGGCSQTYPPFKLKPEHMPQPNQQIRFDPQRAELAKTAARQVKGVEDSTAVVVDQEVLTAIKVSGFNRLRIKSIHKQALEKITKNNHGFKVYLTTDKKLFRQLQHLEKETKEPLESSPLELKAKLNKIIGDISTPHG